MFIDDQDKRKTTVKRKKDDPENYSEDEKERENQKINKIIRRYDRNFSTPSKFNELKRTKEKVASYTNYKKEN